MKFSDSVWFFSSSGDLQQSSLQKIAVLNDPSIEIFPTQKEGMLALADRLEADAKRHDDDAAQARLLAQEARDGAAKLPLEEDPPPA